MDSLSIGLETLLGCSEMLGHALEDRGNVRLQHDVSLMQMVEQASSTPLRSESQTHLFAVAPLDVLVTQENEWKRFHIIELNGTGIGGLVNLPLSRVEHVLDNIGEFACILPGSAPLIMVAVSGKESDNSPRLNRLVYEKVLYVEYLRRQLEADLGEARVLNMLKVLKDPTCLDNQQPTVVLGYMKDFLNSLTCDDEGTLRLMGRRVDAAVNDRFCMNILQSFDSKIDLDKFYTLNRCFLPGGDKGVAYQLLNSYVQDAKPAVIRSIQHARAHSESELQALVEQWLSEGRKAVIKPQGTGLGHGIEFFLDANETSESIRRRISYSIKETETCYGISGGAFPYTVTDFIDTCTIQDASSKFFGHKYELRIVVYRQGGFLRAFPSIIKVASSPYNAQDVTRNSLINNITHSAQSSRTAGTEHMQSLCNRSTLQMLGISELELVQLCREATGYVRHILDQIEDTPEMLGLPPAFTAPSAASLSANEAFALYAP